MTFRWSDTDYVMNDYNGNSMSALRGLDPVRKRPGMYIGSTDGDGVKHCLIEIVDNSIDEAISGHCDTINISFDNEGYITVEDNGRGIPVDLNEESGMCAAILVYTELHAGGKFENKNYKFSGGLHGVGSSVVNALSSHLELTIKRDGYINYIEFKNGGEISTGDSPKIVGTCNKDDTGTSVRYKLDGTHFEGAIVANEWEISREWLATYLSERAAITHNLTINLDYKGEKSCYVAKNGLMDLLDVPQYSDTANPIMTSAISFEDEDTYKGAQRVWDDLNNRWKVDEQGREIKTTSKEQIEIRAAFFVQDRLTPPVVRSFMNNIKTKNHGKHYDGFATGFVEATKDYAIDILGCSQKLISEDILAGCQIVVLAFAQDVEFKSQTKDQVRSQKVATVCSRLVNNFFSRWLQANPASAKKLVDKSIRAARQREANDRAREDEDKSEGFNTAENLTGILTRCRSKKLEDNELFVVEGDSAGGTAKNARCKETQAVLPLRGKILNTYKCDTKKAMRSAQIRILATAIGTGVGSEYNYSKLKFGKIIPLTDADVDGKHISLLFTAFIYKHMPDLIKKGHVFIAETPLYKLEKKGVKKQVVYIKDDEEFNSKYPSGIPAGWTRSRFKGLGEMNPSQLRETAMHRDTRVLKQVVYREEDALMYSELFDILMGDDPSKRLEYIHQYVQFSEE